MLLKTSNLTRRFINENARLLLSFVTDRRQEERGEIQIPGCSAAVRVADKWCFTSPADLQKAPANVLQRTGLFGSHGSPA